MTRPSAMRLTETRPTETRATRARRIGRAGSAIVEFALAAPVLMLLILGASDATRYFTALAGLERLTAAAAELFAGEKLAAPRDGAAIDQSFRGAAATVLTDLAGTTDFSAGGLTVTCFANGAAARSLATLGAAPPQPGAPPLVPGPGAGYVAAAARAQFHPLFPGLLSAFPGARAISATAIMPQALPIRSPGQRPPPC